MDRIMGKKLTDKERIRRSIAGTCAPYIAVAKEYKNTWMPIFNKKGKQIGVIEEGNDGFVQLVVYGKKSGHKFWVYPSHEIKGKISIEYATLDKERDPVWM